MGMTDVLGVDFAFVYTLARYVASFFVYSFSGWLFEVVISLFQHHRFVNRGFSFGPVCPIYGAGALLAILLLSRLGSPLIQFVVGFFAAGVLEFGTSWVMERLFHARWWDYSNIPLNLNGRICVPGLLLFSSLMLGVNLLAQPALDGVFSLVPAQALVMVAMAASLAFAVDLTASVIHMQGMLEKLRGVQTTLSGLPARAREAMRTVLPDMSGIAGLKDDVLDGIRQLVDPAKLEDAQSKLRDAVHAHWSSYERKTMRDPRFRLTQYSEAFEWLRNAVPNAAKLAARGENAARGGSPEKSDADGPDKDARGE